VSAGAAALARMVERVRALRTIETKVAAAARGPVEAAARATAAAGTTPEGSAWAARKDGARALAGAAGAVLVRVVGGSLQIVLRHPYVFHQKTRQVIPVEGDEIPAGILEALRAAALGTFRGVVS
jgi:hypothetical protein